MAMVVVDDRNFLLHKTGRLTSQDRWLGLRVGGHLALLYIHQNRVNSCNDLSHDDSTINIIVVIIIIIIIFSV